MERSVNLSPDPSILDQFVVKVAGRCNIACRYCYMYELGDRTALDTPKFITAEVIDAFALRLREHANATRLEQIVVALHGGEPLLIGHVRFRAIADKLREAIGDRLSLRLQTNGLLVTQKWIDLFTEYRVVVGISLDGPHEINDLARVDHRGDGTYERTLAGLRLLIASQDASNGFVFGGVISVLNPRQSVVKYWEWLEEINATHLGLLLPDADYENYAVHYPYKVEEFSQFLCALFDCWWDSDSQINIRLFDNLVRKSIGGTSDSESIGSPGAPTVIIDTDGAIQAHDVMRINLGQPVFRANVLVDPLVKILEDPAYQQLNRSMFLGKEFRLPTACKQCPVRDLCGGGFVVHRFSLSSGYDNPSIYCAALFSLATHAYLRVAVDAAASENSSSLV